MNATDHINVVFCKFVVFCKAADSWLEIIHHKGTRARCIVRYEKGTRRKY